MTDTTETPGRTIPAEWMSAPQFAKIIRRALKDEFPGVKFSVRSSQYSGGSSVRVGYKGLSKSEWNREMYRQDVEYAPGMPDREQVEAVVGRFETRGFDGMIDMGYYIELAVDSNDRVIGSRSTGTEGSRGTVPAWDDTDTYEVARKVDRFVRGGSFVFVEVDMVA